MLDNIGNESGASPEVASQSTEQSSPATAPTETPAQEAQAVQSPKETPFHEHPRFKEVITQKNELASKFSQAEQMINQMQARLQAFEQAQKQQQKSQGPSYDQLLKRLEGIDPEFASLIKEQHQKTSSFDKVQEEIEQLREWRQQQESERLAQQAESRVTDLYKKNNVPEEQQSLYRAQIENAVYVREASGQRVGIRDLDSIFEQVHGQLSSLFKNYERQTRTSYVTEKKKDAATPSTTGGAPASPAGNQKSMSSDERKAALVKMLKERGSVII